MRLLLRRASNLAACIWPGRGERVLGMVAVAVILLAVLTLSPTLTSMAQVAGGKVPALEDVNRHLNPFRTRHGLYGSGLPVYDLQVDSAALRKVAGIVEEARRRRYLSDDLKQWVPATFFADGERRDVEIRVRGDLPNHWSGTRWSWRVKFDKDEPFLGQREFNLIIGNDGKGITSSFVNAVYRRLGGIVLRDGYCVLRINGALQGVYYRVEHVGEPLLAHHRRPPGTVFVNPRRGLELASWKEQITDHDDVARRALEVLLDFEQDPTPERQAAAWSVTDLEDYTRYIAGTTLFCSSHSKFRGDNQKLYFNPSRGLFERIPWDLASNEIPSVYMSEIEHELATFDIFWWSPMGYQRLAVLKNPELRHRRNCHLWTLVDDIDLMKLFDQTYAQVKDAWWADVMGDQHELNSLDSFRKIVARNQRVIRRALGERRAELEVRLESPARLTLELAVNCGSGCRLEGLTLTGLPAGSRWELRQVGRSGEVAPNLSDLGIGNRGEDAGGASLNRLPSTLLGNAQVDSEGTATLSDLGLQLLSDVSIFENHPVYPVLAGDPPRRMTKPARTIVTPKTVRYAFVLERRDPPTSGTVIPTAGADAASTAQTVIVDAEVYNAVTGEPYEGNDLAVYVLDVPKRWSPLRRFEDVASFVAAHPEFQVKSIHPQATNTASVPEHPDLQADLLRVRQAAEQAQALLLPAGTHRFAEDVVLPEGVALHMEAGCSIELSNGASLISYGPLRIEGTAAQPVRIRPASPGGTWGTVAAVRPGSPSFIEYLRVEGGSGSVIEGVTITGALAIHEGDATIRHCSFSHGLAEDGLNIKNGNVQIRDCVFQDLASDAMDLDFVTGGVTDCSIERVAGDGIDLSGSEITLARNMVRQAGDKAISIGEQSRVFVTDSLLMSCPFGIAAKDASIATIEHCTLLENPRALAAYCKKPIFGGAELEASHCLILGSSEAVMEDGDSFVHLEDCLVQSGEHLAGVEPTPNHLAERLRKHGYVYHPSPGDARHNVDPVDRPAVGIREPIASRWAHDRTE
jgi:hypothetical protein